MPTPFETYLAKLQADFKGGKATEYTYRSALECLLESLADHVAASNDPKHIARGAPDFIVERRKVILGHDENNRGVLFRQWEAFQQHLIPTLKHGEFADLYAQTMAYGLFAARVNAPDGQPFDRAQAYGYLPPANPFLRKLFLDVGEELDGTVIAPFLDDLALLLKRADMSEIRRDFGRRAHTEDPVVHFYETFLAACDPAMRASRGVYYTPEPVVKFIVNSVDAVLRAEFKKSTGLADPEVLLLDPATGTGTFLYYVIRCIYETQQRRGQTGAWRDYVQQHLLKRLYGFELLIAPYAIAHLKLAGEPYR